MFIYIKVPPANRFITVSNRKSKADVNEMKITTDTSLCRSTGCVGWKLSRSIWKGNHRVAHLSFHPLNYWTLSRKSGCSISLSWAEFVLLQITVCSKCPKRSSSTKSSLNSTSAYLLAFFWSSSAGRVSFIFVVYWYSSVLLTKPHLLRKTMRCSWKLQKMLARVISSIYHTDTLYICIFRDLEKKKGLSRIQILALRQRQDSFYP